MHILLSDSSANGHTRRFEARRRVIDKDVRAGSRDGVVGVDADFDDPDFDDKVNTPPERLHRPWLVLGVGRL